MPSAVRITDGQGSFEGGVDSGRTPTLANQANQIGLRPNQLAWTVNATVRGGGVGCRTGFRQLDLDFSSLEDEGTAFKAGLFQGAYMYDPPSGLPYIVASISGRIYRIRVDTDNAVQDITPAGDSNSPTIRNCWMVQGEQFLIIQNGVDIPFIWDGTTLRRSVTVANEVPIGRAMDYYMGRLWVQLTNRTYVGSDIVGGPSGTAPYAFTDSILSFTECGVFGTSGGAFAIPTNAGAITSLSHTALMDTALGEGVLIVGTRTAVYATSVPVDRAAWGSTTEPLQRVIQRKYGPVSDRCMVPVNGDLFYRAPDGYRSLLMAVRDFQQWGNTPISRNENRIINAEDRGLMDTASGILFDNRLMFSCLPIDTSQGTVFTGIAPLDFDIISSFGEKSPPAWEGMLNGLQTFQLLEADYGGLQRGFSIALSATNEIEVWELTTADRYDNVNRRISWAVETPSYVWQNPFQLKRLETIELWVDKMFGLVEFEVWYRPDQHPCWIYWHTFQDCAVRNPCEDPDLPSCYVMQSYREQYRSYTLPVPPNTCDGNNVAPYQYGYQFQFMIVVTGWARIRSILAHAIPVEKPPFKNIVC